MQLYLILLLNGTHLIGLYSILIIVLTTDIPFSGPPFVMSQLNKVVRGNFVRSIEQMYADRSNAGILETFSVNQFIQKNQHAKSFVCWKNGNVPPLYDLMVLH